MWLERPFALIGWTGSRMWNRFTRHLANQHGLSLSAHGLIHIPDQHGECRLVPYETHPGAGVVRNEEDVMRLIGLPWVPPHLRNA